MREDWPSLTATYVAFVRALATRDAVLVHACRDPYAAALLPRALAPLLRQLERGATGARLNRRLQQLSAGLAHHIALRTALIDRALGHGLKAGIEQVVLLGAGFDARAHRMTELANVTLFEVDHAATQRVKQQRALALPIAARSLRYLPCNFESEPFEELLTRAGFAPEKRSLWLWEGVTMYLAPAAVADTLGAIARLSAPGSLLIATYLTPGIVHGSRALGRLAAPLLGLLSEPIRFAVEPPELARLLHDHGFALLSDAAPKDAAPHFGIELGRLAALLPAERLAIAIREGASP